MKLSKSLFARFFGFEEGIDITNEIEVLKRRNIVIKNIILVSNIFYFFLMLIVSLVSTDQNDQIFNWVVTAATFPLTIVINYFLSSLIYKNSKQESDNLASQQIAMYFAVVYLFLSATLFYLKVHNVNGLETFSYILFYYVVAVISLYQDKKVLLNGALGLFSILTILHFFVTYYSPTIISNGGSAVNLMFADIGLRSLIFVIYITALYATVSIAQYMHSERISELIKRKEVENDFQSISSDLFKVVLSSSKAFFNLKRAEQVNNIAMKLAQLYGFSRNNLIELENYSLIHLRYQEIENIDQKVSDSDYDGLRDKTKLAANISKRIQLAQKCEDIARGQVEGSLSQSFVYEMNKLQQTVDAQIILLADLYITMRAAEPYKRPQTHAAVMKVFDNEFSVFFNKELLQIFVAFNQEFANIYDNF